MMRYDVHTTLTADVAHCTLHFASGLVGTLSAYHVTPYRHTFNLFGTKMNLYLDEHACGDPSYYAVQYRKRGEAEPHVPFKFEGPSDICGNLKSFFKAVREGGEPYPSLRDGARAVRDQAPMVPSARTGRFSRASSPNPHRLGFAPVADRRARHRWWSCPEDGAVRRLG